MTEALRNATFTANRRLMRDLGSQYLFGAISRDFHDVPSLALRADDEQSSSVASHTLAPPQQPRAPNVTEIKM